MRNNKLLSCQLLVGCSMLNVECWTFLRVQLLLSLFVAHLCLGPVLTSATPYEAIVGRNAFGLKPPPNPADLIKAPPPVVADIKLQGITTILGRKQVLMKIKVPARPGEAASEQSLVLSEGQREGEVEVLEINAAEGTVLVKNNGSPLSLNMKDNAEKPTPGAAPTPGGAPPTPGVNAPPPGLPRQAIPGVPPATPSSAALPGNSGGVTTFGGTETRSNPNLPARTMRTGNAAGAGGSPLTPAGLGSSQSQSSYQPPASNLSVDEQMALLELHRAANPTMPFPPLPQKYQQQK